MSSEINFFKEGVRFRLSRRELLKKWIGKMAAGQGHKIDCVNFIFCGDAYLRKMNRQFLRHDYNTDIITFDNSERSNYLSGDIFISIDSVRKNAKMYDATFDEELHRVMAHGILHLLGHDDKSKGDRGRMRELEDEWLEGLVRMGK